jgi:hypothetical protein
MVVEKPKWLDLNQISDQHGVLHILEMPFEVKRTYFIQDVPRDSKRGFHAHRSLKQIFFAPQGNFKIELSTAYGVHCYTIDSSDGRALLVPAGYWRVLFDFSNHATCMVLASEHYEESDYMRDFDEYLSWFKENFDNES